ncbi:HEAT repeat domain-containing protein [Chryseobacterium defluvii]|uniref:HEAT repeat protein n=1 Tax=Chryseobacterium defluvii TaxID=160396 RepID=A0A495SBC2_9FLAO|nr:HEAT repeat domain-containing protein [Chryseobacterium defluvii]RKS97528.1 HEAT repeat protein [Chryseobacterium defluvii]
MLLLTNSNSIHYLFLVFLGMLSLVVLLIIVVLIYSFYQYKESVRVSQWSGIINEKVTETIVYDEGEIAPNNSFAAFSDYPLFRNLFLKKLVETDNKFSGAAQNKIKDLFNDYNLQNEAFKKLNQKQPYLIAGGIQELTAMNVEAALPKISSFLTHPSVQVYQEAQYAMVSFKGFEGLHFLDTISTKISEWQQLRLLISITDIPADYDDTLKNWLESSNDTVVIFTLRLLKKFQLLSLYPMVMNLLNHPSVEVRIQAVKALQSLENSSTITELTDIYPHQPFEVQLEILRVMRVLKEQCCAGFLQQQLVENPFSAVKIYAAEALFSLGHHDYLVQVANDKASSEQLVQIIKHALQEKIC